MITSLRLVNFKNFADETLRVGPFTVLVGANASGKSNIRDAFRILHGIGRRSLLPEIIGGNREAGWQPIRGAYNEIIRFGQSAFSLEVGLNLHKRDLRYLIEIGHDEETGTFHVRKEEFQDESRIVYTADWDPAGFIITKNPDPWPGDQHKYLGFPHLQPILSTSIFDLANMQNFEDAPDYRPSLAEDAALIERSIEMFGSIRFFELSLERMREPAFPDATTLGDSGENLTAVLHEIYSDPKRRETLISWVRELTPMDVTDLEFPRDPSGRVHLMLGEANGRKVSAYSASDGTLRFLAILAVLLGKNSEGLYFFEEIDTGIHPARQWLLLELIEKQVAKNNIQIMTTTHAPDLLTFVNDSTFENTSVVCRLEDSHDSIIRPVAELPDAKKLRKSGRGLGGLLTEGWMETALAFTENHDEAEGDGE